MPVVAIHVRQDGAEVERPLTERAGIELRQVTGTPADAIVDGAAPGPGGGHGGGSRHDRPGLGPAARPRPGGGGPRGPDPHSGPGPPPAPPGMRAARPGRRGDDQRGGGARGRHSGRRGLAPAGAHPGVGGSRRRPWTRGGRGDPARPARARPGRRPGDDHRPVPPPRAPADHLAGERAHARRAGDGPAGRAAGPSGPGASGDVARRPAPDPRSSRTDPNPEAGPRRLLGPASGSSGDLLL